jgi:hypothetical protein
MTRVTPEVVLEIGRPQPVGVWRALAEVTLQKLAGVPQPISARVPGESTSLPEVRVVLGEERTECRCGWPQPSGIVLIEHAEQMADRRATGVEAPWEGSRARASREMVLEELARRRSGDEVGRHDGMPCAKEVAIMLRSAHELVDEARCITGLEQIVSELIEDDAERVALQSADVMGPLKEPAEHGCPP